MARFDVYHAGVDNLRDIGAINNSLLEKALEMRVVSYMAHIKGQLLLNTIREVGREKKSLRAINDRLLAANMFLQDQTQTSKSHIRLLEAVESISDGFSLYDSDKRLLICNKHFEKIWTAVEDIIKPGISLLEFTDALIERNIVDGTAEQIKQWREQKVSQNASSGEDFTIRLRNGRWIRSRVYSNEDGGFVIIDADITDLKDGEEQLRLSQRMEALGQLTAGISHDFNNLLAIITGNIELSLSNPNDPDVSDRLKTADEAAQKSADLIQRLLTYSKHQKLEPEFVDTENLVLELMKLLRRALGETIKVDTQFQEGLSKIFVDRSHLENALLNLSINARDAMPSGGNILIKARNQTIDEDSMSSSTPKTSGDYVVISVLDNGTGIPENILDRVLEPYFTTKGPGKGNGLGLSMVYGFVTQSEGHIAIHSVEGEGAKIELFFPVYNQEPAPPVRDDRHENETKGSGEKIYLIEDEVLLRDTLKTMLTDLGYTVVDGGAGEDAMTDNGQWEEIDLLLTDIYLPDGRNGSKIATWVENTFPNIKILLMSGYAKSENTHAEDGSALFSYIKKPFRKRLLAQSLHDLLNET